MADAGDSKSPARKGVPVQVRGPAMRGTLSSDKVGIKYNSAQNTWPQTAIVELHHGIGTKSRSVF